MLLPTLVYLIGPITRGNALKLATVRPNLDIRKYTFSVRMMSVWNTLPDSVVASDTISKFKNAL